MAIGLGWLIAAFLVSAGVSYYSTKQMQKKAKEAADRARGVLIQRSGVDQQVPVVYGTRRVAGIRVFTESQDVSGGLPNEVLYMILVLCEGEVESIGDVMVNGELLEGSRYDGTTRNGAYPLIDMEFYTGVAGQTADSTFVSECASFNSTFTYSGLAYVAVKIRMPDSGDKNPFSGSIPEFTFLVKGKKVYDPRYATTSWSNNPALCIRDYLTDTTYGRGLDASYINSTDLEDAADFYDQTDTLVSGGSDTVGIPDSKRVSGYGAATMSSYQIKFDAQNVTTNLFPGATITQNGNSFKVLAVYYAMDSDGVSNTFVTYHYGLSAPSPDMDTTNTVTVSASETPWTCDAVLDTSAKLFDNISSLLFGCRASLPFTQGQYSLLPDTVGEPEMTVDESMIIGGISLTLADKSTRLNQIRYKYPDPKNDYETSEGVFPDPASTTYLAWLAEDNNEPLDDEIEVTTAASEWAAENLAKAIVFHSRYNNTIAFTATSELLQMRVGSVFKLNYASYGWEDESEDYGSVADAVDDSDDYGSVADAADTFLDYRFVTEDIEGVEFRVEAISINPDFTCSIAAREHNEGAYELDAAAARAHANKTSLPDAFNVGAPTGLSLSDASSLLGDGSLATELAVSWTASTDPFVEQYEIQWKKDSDSDYHSLFTRNTDASIHGLAIDTYDVRVRALNGIGSTSDWITGSQLVDDDTTAPSAPTSLTATSGPLSIEISWTNDSAADLAQTKIHVRTVNTTPTDDTYLEETVASIPSKTQTYRIAAGNYGVDTTYYIWLEHVDHAGNQSDLTLSVNAQFLAPSLSDLNLEQLGYDFTPARPVDQTLSTSSIVPHGVFIKPGGLKLYLLDTSTFPNERVREYDLSTAYDISSATHNQDYTLGDSDLNQRGLFFSDDGTKMFHGGLTGKVHESSLSTAWDISTASYVDSYDTTADTSGGTLASIWFSADGDKFYVVDKKSSYQNVYEFDLSTDWDVSTASYGGAFDYTNESITRGGVTTSFTSPTGIVISEDGEIMLLTGGGSLASDIFVYRLTTPWDVTTAKYDRPASILGGGVQDDGAVTSAANGNYFYYSATNLSQFRTSYVLG